jgi:hypothetical protein
MKRATKPSWGSCTECRPARFFARRPSLLGKISSMTILERVPGQVSGKIFAKLGNAWL